MATGNNTHLTQAGTATTTAPREKLTVQDDATESTSQTAATATTAVQSPQAVKAEPAISPKEEKKPAIDTSKKTTGEKAYGILQFMTGKVFIMLFTAVIAYYARYGKEWYNEDGKVKIPNIFKMMDDKFKTAIVDRAETHAKQLDEGGKNKKAEWLRIFAASAANTTVTFHGGNAFAPFMKKIENSKNKIVNAINKRFGKEGELELGHERTKDEPEQTWGDILKGRIIAWVIVFTSFTAACVFIGKNKKLREQTGADKYWFDVYEDGFGRALGNLRSKWKGEGKIFPTQMEVPNLKENSKDPVHQKLATDSWYRFGKITGIDFYATSAAIAIWNFVSRMSAKKKADAAKIRNETEDSVSKTEISAAESIKPTSETALSQTERDNPPSHTTKEASRREQAASMEHELAIA